MINYLYYMLIAIFTISNIEIAEARKINLKVKKHPNQNRLILEVKILSQN